MKKFIFSLILVINFKASANLQISNLVTPAVYFINHEKELKNLNNKLGLYNTAGIVGVSGIGKTQLARMYAYNNISKYNIIWFFDCNADLSEQFVDLIKKINKTLELNGEKKLLEDPKQAKSAIIEYLTSKQGWLMIFDNLKLNQNTQLQDIISWEHNGHVILCSQDATGLSDAIQLPYLSLDNSMNLVRTILNDSNPELVIELASLFQGYPLLIVQSAMFLSENKYMSAMEYKKLIKKADNKPGAHINIVLGYLPESSKNLLHQISVINNHLISKNILENIIESKESLSEDIYNLKKFGLIMTIDNEEAQQVFEMHDMIKETVIEIIGEKVVKENISEIIDKLNTLIPKGVVSRYLVLTEDPALKSNLEVLLDNAEKHGVNINKILELRKNLMSLYLGSLDYYNCQKMTDWLLARKESKSFKQQIQLDKDKVTYSEYLTDIGVYEDFAKTDYITSIKFLEEAKSAIEKLHGHPEVEFTIFSQLAQIYAFCGNIIAAEENLNVVEQLVKTNKEADFDLGLYWFIRAKVYLSQGNYQEAENAIEKNIEVEKHLPQNTFTAPTYILQAEILNYLNNFQKAYNTSKRIYDQESKNIRNEHEIHARILTQMSKAELELGDHEQAFLDIEKAINIFMKNDNVTEFKQLTNSHNTDLAAALVVKAEILTKMGNILEAMEFYATAETIFYNRYENNIHNMDNVSYLYAKAAEASYGLKDSFWYTKFSTQLIEKFGKNHFRVKSVLKQQQ